MNTTDQQARLGLTMGLGAYLMWGVIPMYFRLLRHLPPLEVLGHRIAWSCILLTGLLVATRRLDGLRQALQSRHTMLLLTASTVLIAINWFTYIYAVSVERVLEASLGYFITPLVNVILGVVFLRERLRPVQLLSLVLATAAVAYLTSQGNGVPWIALALAGSFAFYGLLRKTVAVDATLGLFIETALLTPVALLVLAVMQTGERSTALSVGGTTLGLLILSGLVTSVPLIFFAGAARRLRLATLGFLQYLAPTVQFLLAVLAFGEPFTRVQMVSFAGIWAAVVIYTVDSLWHYAGRERETPPAKPEPCVAGASE